jgi:hypothetical protein
MKPQIFMHLALDEIYILRYLTQKSANYFDHLVQTALFSPHDYHHGSTSVVE